MKHSLSEILIHLGEERSAYFNAIAPPIIQSSNFASDSIADFRKTITDEKGTHVYTRGNNPTVEILRQKLAALEQTDDAIVFGSGSAACAMAIMSQVNAGDHVVCVRHPYSWTHALLEQYLPRFNVSTTFVDGTQPSEIEAAIQPNTRVLYLESPNSLTYEIQDLEACAALARKHGLVSMIDNSYASPVYQQPATYGIDLIIHSVSKYLNGHSDVVAGVICGRQDLIDRIFFAEYMTLGAAISPHDAALVIRGLRTLHLRLARCSESAQTIVTFLKGHTRVRDLIYPLDPDFPQYALASKQMSGAGGLVTIALKAEHIEQINAFADALKLFKIAVSWGGHESLVLPIAALYGLEGREDPAIPWNVLRLYIGLDDADALIADLAQALDQMG